MKIIYTFGIFDLMNYGHIRFLKKSKENSDLHIVGLLSDRLVESWMGTYVSTFDERKAVLESNKFVDIVLKQETYDPIKNLESIHSKYPDAEIFMYKSNRWNINLSEEYLKSINCKVIENEYYSKMSPEKIYEKLGSRNKKAKNYGSIISTKANTLISLKNVLMKSKIEEIYVFKVEEYLNNKIQVMQEISNKFKKGLIVVRSSSSKEDGFENSNAGYYESVLNIDVENKEQLEKAIDKVMYSYGNTKDNFNEQILVQKQTLDVAKSGVLFTRDIKENTPYYLINYDDSGSTSSVTDGSAGVTLWISRDLLEENLPSKWKRLIESVKEIESILPGVILDIEFAILKNGKIVIFQVRPLAANYKYNIGINDEKLFELKNSLKETYENYKFNDIPMMLSDMAFWNPSEIIGANPKFLDYSLYREIITERTWNMGLVPMGYNEVNDELMYKIGNKPYISIDYSFYSLIPSSLDKNLIDKLVLYYKNKLSKDLSAHDKIEFEIVSSCYDFNTSYKLKELLNYGFTEKEVGEISSALFNLTEESILNFRNVLEEDLLDLEKLNEIKNRIELNQGSEDLGELINDLEEIINAIIQYGTPQFSRQARYAFISRSLCNTLVSDGYIEKEEMDKFMLSIETVASEFEEDFKLFLNGKMEVETFNSLYGHLRSGTYDINTPRYEDMEFKLDKELNLDIKKNEVNLNGFSLNKKEIGRALLDIKFDIDVEIFIQFLRDAFEQREYFKFEFTKSLSLAIELIAYIGNLLGFNRADMSYLEIEDLYSYKLYKNDFDFKNHIKEVISIRKKIYESNSKVKLPEVIENTLDLDIILLDEARPNFITTKIISEECIFLENDLEQDIKNKIVVITKADPGFDWIFTQNISGLVTKYGGAASHMAIRCAEFGIPAAIGCGEKIYDELQGCKYITIDCANNKVKKDR